MKQICLGFLLAAALLLIVWGSAALIVGGREESKRGVTPVSAANFSSFLETVEHDGHKFVVGRAVEAIAITHHPGCSCLERKP